MAPKKAVKEAKDGKETKELKEKVVKEPKETKETTKDPKEVKDPKERKEKETKEAKVKAWTLRLDSIHLPSYSVGHRAQKCEDAFGGLYHIFCFFVFAINNLSLPDIDTCGRFSANRYRFYWSYLSPCCIFPNQNFLNVFV